MKNFKKIGLKRNEDLLGSKELINRLSNSFFPRISYISKVSTNGKLYSLVTGFAWAASPP